MSDASRVVLVTGAASGMGLVTSRRFLDSGDRVVVVGQTVVADVGVTRRP